MTQIGLALIARDEEDSLPTLLDSVYGVFNRVVLLDTGSTDKTKDLFIKWASMQVGVTYSVGDFEWCDDFGAARIAADKLLGDTVDWKVWADCDDTIVGAQNIRTLCDNAPPELDAFIFDYTYATHPQTGQILCTLKRERVVRTGRGVWKGRVHEGQVFDNGQHVAPDICHWLHHKPIDNDKPDDERNLSILRKWNDDEPGNTRVIQYIGTELGARGRYEDAIAYFTDYNDHYQAEKAHAGYDQEWAQVQRKLSVAYMSVGDYAGAIDAAMSCVRECPQWPDSYLSLAEANLGAGKPQLAAEFAREAIGRGEPATALIINPLDYSFLPRRALALAFAEQNFIEDAERIGKEAMAIFPADALLNHQMQLWRDRNKRERTADTIILMAQQLTAHDEQEKALILLEHCCPYFVQDHPKVITARSQLRERLRWLITKDYDEHYRTGGSKPEDFHDDETSLKFAENLPRSHFLLAGLNEQAGLDA